MIEVDVEDVISKNLMKDETLESVLDMLSSYARAYSVSVSAIKRAEAQK